MEEWGGGGEGPVTHNTQTTACLFEAIMGGDEYNMTAAGDIYNYIEK